MHLSAGQEKEISEVLGRWGLDTKEQQAYRVLLAQGSSTLTPLSRALRVPATTAQAVLERLEKQGLVLVTARKSRRVWEAHEPARLKRLLEERMREVSNIIPLLKSLSSQEQAAARVRIFWRDRATDIFRQALGTKSKLVYEIVSAGDFQETIGERFHFTTRRLEEGVRLKSLRVEAKEIKKYSRQSHVRELREARFLPREMTFRSSVMFWDDTVAFLASSDEGLSFTVQSISIREMFEQMFDLFWSVSRPMETAVEKT